ncbi:MAG: hypothetical protein QG577_911 [Thermodesulfobacteriota bacterium]|nr:hypothetical protein [Thermodesulfobacteriota bacterium]
MNALKPENGVPILAVLRCRKCGHESLSDARWVYSRFPALSALTETQLLKELHVVSKRFVCKTCGHRGPDVCAPKKPSSSHLLNHGDTTKSASNANENMPCKSQSHKAYDKPAKHAYRKEARKIDELLESASWLYQAEVSLLESMHKLATSGRSLSDKQRKVLSKIGERIQLRQTSNLLEGGSPGLGRRNR